ncbi:hypothetical protein V5738_18365 [Salinisphaera sp. SPP-AMP-43]|uniref:hypothetical protein n=1 Tax=Salinisphaera sp. SPP-AMP-43 TaxID=3121288 RepID=UPI003C6E9C15
MSERIDRLRAATRSSAYLNGGTVDRLIAGFIHPERGVVVTGFWRSGTTFLLERLTQMLRGKPLFEPFQPELPSYQAIVDAARPAAVASKDFDAYFMPYAMTDAMAGYIDRVLRYRIVDQRIQRSRTNLTAHGRRPTGVPALAMQQWLALRTSVVVKFVRASLLIPALRRCFAGPVFHIRRQPYGVLASFKTADWSAFQPARISLRRLLLDIDDGRAAFFAPWQRVIDALDRGDAWRRLMGYWALTERFVDAHAEHYTILSYEALATGELDLADCLARQGLFPSSSASASFNSSTTSAHRAHLSARERAEGWRDVLSQAEIDTVDDVVDRVYSV